MRQWVKHIMKGLRNIKEQGTQSDIR